MTETERGKVTLAEIHQQPELWPGTVRRVKESGIPGVTAPVLTGAGTSAYAAMAIAAAWPGSRAVPSTDLFLDFRSVLAGGGTVVSIARSGDSPESIAVVDKIQRAMPEVRHVAITCNAEGKLAQWPGVEVVMLDPRTNDRGLAMTSSYSNMVLAGITLARPKEADEALPKLCAGWPQRFCYYEELARALSSEPPRRLVALASTPLFGAAREACLKTLEMTAGRVATMAETFLAFRHGPMSFLEHDTLALCFLSSDAVRRRYEMDVVRELRAKGLGRLIAIGVSEADNGVFDEIVTTGASRLPDYLRAPAEIVFPQMLAFHLSLRSGLDPDNPSPGRVITRVVEGVKIYPE